MRAADSVSAVIEYVTKWDRSSYRMFESKIPLSRENNKLYRSKQNLAKERYELV